MFNQTKHEHMKHLYVLLAVFSKNEILLKHISNFFAINGIQDIKMPINGFMVIFKNFYK